MLGRLITRLLRPRLLVPLSVALLCVAELAIADRKFGIFSGGFGQSSTVDRAPELALFAIGYLLAQMLAALIAWWLCDRLSRRRRTPVTMVHFAFVYLGLGLFTLTAQYQLHSYFSDAVDFALIKQLGGGSLGDALLFGKNEIALAAGAAALFAAVWWLVARIVRRVTAGQALAISGPPGWRMFALLGVLLVTALLAIPRADEDTARGLNRTLAWNAGMGLVAQGTDFDRDGYGLAGLRRDTHPFDPARHPLALDVPGNGVDEDGYAGDLALVPVPQPRAAASEFGDRPNLVIVVLESTRADAVGKRIDGRLVAPNLTGLASDGGAVVPAYSHVGFTTESLKSLFSGRLVPQPGDPSMFTELKQAGYRAGVFSGQPEDFGGISQTVAMRSNVDVFIDAEALKEERAFSFAAQGSLLIDEAILLREFNSAFGRKSAWDAPVFLYFNFQSPHFPYDHPGVGRRFADPPLARSAISADNRAGVERTYWNAVAHADAALGEVIARLKALGQWENTILAVIGDHGEALFENGFLGHGHVIEDTQYATFLVTNRPLGGLAGPIALSDYRGILHDLLAGRSPTAPDEPPFLYIGDLATPTAIGLADRDFGLVSLRLDTGETCFLRERICRRYAALQGKRQAAADRLVARWGSERWALRTARE